MDFPVYAAEKLDKLIGHYSEKFTFEYGKEIAGEHVPVVAGMHDRQPVSIMGFGTKAMGPEASEYIFFITAETFDDGVMASIDKILKSAESEYVRPSKDHAFTFLSVVALVKDADGGALKTLKKYKMRKDYSQNGWLLSRVVVLTEDGSAYNSNDGADLRRLLQKVIKL